MNPSRARLRFAAAPKLIAITDALHRGHEETLARIGAFCHQAEPGSVLIQLRDRELGDRQRLALGRELKAMAQRHGHWLAVNDRADFVSLLEADALHLPENGIEPEDARALLGPAVWISRAIHRPDAEVGEVDALVLSPIAEPRKDNPALGFDALTRARQAYEKSPRRPLIYALGGISAENAAVALQAGADGVALMGGLFVDPVEPLLANLGILR